MTAEWPCAPHLPAEERHEDDDDDFLETPRLFGADGLVTQVFEHIPIVSDAVMAVHYYAGQDEAAERTRAYTMEKLLSKDGTITRLAELVPVSNLVAAALHEIRGDRDEALRALDMLGNWSNSFLPDGPFARVAELLPGTDVLAFTVHLQGGHYAQALRSITKTSWVNVAADSITVTVGKGAFKNFEVRDIEAKGLDVTPRQLSLVVALSDVLINFIRVDREGCQRQGRTERGLSCDGLDPTDFVTGGGVAEDARATERLAKELLKALIDEKLQRWGNALIDVTDESVTWFAVDVMNRWAARRAAAWPLLFTLAGPGAFQAPPCCMLDEIKNALPRATVTRAWLPDLEPQPLKRRRARVSPEGVAASCFAAAGLVGLGAKAGLLACGAGIAAGVAAVARACAQRAASWLEARNAAAWAAAVLAPQPQDTDAPGADSPAGAEARLEGVVIEFERSDARRLGRLVRSYIDSAWRGRLARLAERALRAAARGILQTEGTVAHLVLEAELDDWDITLESWPGNLSLPPMRFAVVLHLGMDGGSPLTQRAFAVLPCELLDRVATKVQEQVAMWDMRNSDPRFAGFRKPAYIDFALKVCWPTESTLQLQATGVRSRLDLPD